MSTKIRVPTSVDHPLGDGTGITVTEEGGQRPPVVLPVRQSFGALLFLTGLVLLGAVSYRLSFTLFLAYVSLACLVIGGALSYESAPTDEEA